VWDASDQKQWIEYWYDAYGRVEDVNYPDGGSIHYTYDGFGRKTQIADYRNSADNIDGTGKISYEYDVLDRVSKITDQDGWIVEYDYMSDGQKSQVKVCHPVDGTVKYHVANLYDKALRLQYVAEPLNGTTTGWIARVDYDDNGNRAGLTYYREGTLEGATTTIAYDYNLDNRLTAYSTSGGPTFALSSVTVDGLGRLVEAEETLTKPDSSTITHALDYTYDRRSQLLSASMTNIGGSTWQASYAYDKAGNIYSETINSTPTAFTYDGDLMTAKGQDSLDWDLNGQMTTGITSSMTWTWDGKLQSASAGGASIDLKYAPGFDRVYKESTVNQTMTKSKYIVDPTGDMSLILLEINADENDPNACIRKTYIYANSQVIAQHDGFYGDGIYFYLHDRLGSVRQVIDTSANVQNTYMYQPFGESFASEQAETITNDFKFTGQYYDSETDQYYLRARQYIPALYRLPSRDPYEGAFESPLELHCYLYCLNEPVSSWDPSGEMTIIGIVIGSGTSNAMRSQEMSLRKGQLAAVSVLLGGILVCSYDHDLQMQLTAATEGVLSEIGLMMAAGKDLLRGGKKSQRDKYYGREKEPDFNKFKKWLDANKKKLFGKRGQSLTREEMEEAWEIWDGWGRPGVKS
ncbi:MAG TPA: RHS repeat-associated core domain-containing protein, partial [Anaerohalosphaeraceae bacterium]|nr:RHS repeat-associated core domain-containing protein [Anaerohalosphaeraceae bacterium]HRT52426.1 RHS repeat-associated core domain-containing protein [Anaerohalosphaeraceae bacterium]HRT88470.1 RHS repeat-associated core domain-containing protein [Anaerohalosphaeraceae bacterium]